MESEINTKGAGASQVEDRSNQPQRAGGNHFTGKIRGLVDAHCNSVIGSIESPLFKKAKKYLEKYK